MLKKAIENKCKDSKEEEKVRELQTCLEYFKSTALKMEEALDKERQKKEQLEVRMNYLRAAEKKNLMVSRC